MLAVVVAVLTLLAELAEQPLTVAELVIQVQPMVLLVLLIQAVAVAVLVKAEPQAQAAQALSSFGMRLRKEI